jgi:hypothetical protein
MRGSAIAVALVLAGALSACNNLHARGTGLKERADAENPGPTVIVEQPGATPVESPDDGSATSGVSEPEVSSRPGDRAEFGTLDVLRTDVACQADADCVKDSCCHATSCVAIADAPDCSAAVCTLDCRAGTMDCYGGCVCQDGRCAARRWTPPDQ